MQQYQSRLGYFLLHYLHTVSRLAARNSLGQVEQGYSDSTTDIGEIMIGQKVHRAQTAVCVLATHVEYLLTPSLTVFSTVNLMVVQNSPALAYSNFKLLLTAISIQCTC